MVELGAGVGLAGIVAAKIGAASVVMTDRGDEPSILDNIRHNITQNKESCICRTQALTWGHFSAQTCQLQASDFDILLAADCLYASRDFDSFFATVAFLLARKRTDSGAGESGRGAYPQCARSVGRPLPRP